MKFRKGMNLAGQRFTRLLAISHTDISTSKGLLWNCLCDCGNSVRVAAYYLKSSATKSCGCFFVAILCARPVSAIFCKAL